MSDVKEVTLGKALSLTSEALTKAVATIEAIDKGDINTLLKAFRQLDICKDQFTLIQKEMTRMHKRLSSEIIPEVFENNGFDSIKSGGYNFIVAAKFYASIPANKQAEGYAWLKAQGLDGLIQEKVNAMSLSSAVKNYMETTGIAPPEDAISTHTEKYTQVRKS